VENIGIADILVILCVLMDLLFGYSLAFSRELQHAFWSVTKSSSRPQYQQNVLASAGGYTRNPLLVAANPLPGPCDPLVKRQRVVSKWGVAVI
jgi:hypothetical protein